MFDYVSAYIYITAIQHNYLDEVFGLPASAVVLLVLKDNISLIKVTDKILEKWHENFRAVFYNLLTADVETLQNLSHCEIITKVGQTSRTDEIKWATSL